MSDFLKGRVVSAARASVCARGGVAFARQENDRTGGNVHLMKNVFKRAAKGAHVPHHKNTQNSATVDMPVPAKILLPMQQHIGAAVAPVVKEGDPVFVGTVVGESASPLSAPIHSSVSGTVTALGEVKLPNKGGRGRDHIRRQTNTGPVDRPARGDRLRFVYCCSARQRPCGPWRRRLPHVDEAEAERPFHGRHADHQCG